MSDHSKAPECKHFFDQVGICIYCGVWQDEISKTPCPKCGGLDGLHTKRECTTAPEKGISDEVMLLREKNEHKKEVLCHSSDRWGATQDRADTLWLQLKKLRDFVEFSPLCSTEATTIVLETDAVLGKREPYSATASEAQTAAVPALPEMDERYRIATEGHHKMSQHVVTVKALECRERQLLSTLAQLQSANELVEQVRRRFDFEHAALQSANEQIVLLKGAMAAQDEREFLAGEKCGVGWAANGGCDWPDAVAEALQSANERAEEDAQTISKLVDTLEGANDRAERAEKLGNYWMELYQTADRALYEARLSAVTPRRQHGWNQKGGRKWDSLIT